MFAPPQDHQGPGGATDQSDLCQNGDRHQAHGQPAAAADCRAPPEAEGPDCSPQLKVQQWLHPSVDRTKPSRSVSPARPQRAVPQRLKTPSLVQSTNKRFMQMLPSASCCVYVLLFLFPLESSIYGVCGIYGILLMVPAESFNGNT